MNRKLTTLLVSGLFVVATAGTATAHHSSGHTQNHFGLCTAYSNNGGYGDGNGQGGQNGQAFKTFEDTVTENDEYDDLEEYCREYLAENHPSDNGGGRG